MALIASAVLALILVQTPKVQTKITDALTERYLSNLDADISFSKISLRPFHTLVVKDLVILDKDPQTPAGKVADRWPDFVPVDTLACARSLIVTLSLDGLTKIRKGEAMEFKRVQVKDGSFNMVLEEDHMHNMKRIFKMKDKEPGSPRSTKELFFVEKVTVENFRYTMTSLRKPRKDLPENCIDWCDLEVYDIDAEGSNIRMSRGILTATLEKASAKEKSGYSFSRISASTAIGNGQAVIQDIHLQDNWSDISLPHYIMSYDSNLDFREYLQKVGMDFRFSETKINSQSLGFFAPAVKKMDLEVIADGSVYGPASGLHFDNFNFMTSDGSFSIDLNGDVTGLPDINAMKMDLTLDNCKTTVDAIERLIGSVSGKKDSRFGKVRPSTWAELFGRVHGQISDMDASVYLNSGIGDVLADMNISNLLKDNKPIVIDGELQTENLDLGKAIGKDFLGECSVRSAICATLDKKNGPHMRIDSVMVDKLGLLGYDYHRIAATGELSKTRFEGRIISQDPACNFLFQGIFSLAPKTKNAVYQFYANVGQADLHAMNIDRRESSNVSFTMNANFNRTNDGHLLGNISVGKLMLESDMEKHNIGDIAIASHSINNRYRMSLTSNFAEASYVGSKPVTSFVSDLMDVTIRKELPALFQKQPGEWDGSNYELSLKCFNTSALTAFFKPGLYIDNNTALGLSVARSGEVKAWLKSHRIALKEQYLKDIDLQINNASDRLEGSMKCGEINASSILFQNDDITLYANDNEIGFGVSFENEGNIINKGEFFTRGEVSRDENDKLSLDVGILPSGFSFNSSEWSIMPSQFHLKGKTIKIDGVQFTNGDQAIIVDGGITKEGVDTLTVSLDRFNIEAANPFIRKKDIDLHGAMTGSAMITSNHDEKKGILANFLIDSTYVSGTSFGNVTASSIWNRNFKRFDIDLRNSLDGHQSISGKAAFYPAARRLEATVDLEKQEVNFAKVFLKGIFSEIEGNITGRISAEGPLDDLSISSMGTRLDNTMLKIDYTCVPYWADGPFHIDNNGVYFDDIPIRDAYKGSGMLKGGISWDHFKDMRMNIHADTYNMEVLNRPYKDTEGYYGHVFGTGSVDISGRAGDITIAADMRTSDQSSFSVPLSNSFKTSSSDLLKFKEPEVEVFVDEYEEMMAKLRKSESCKKAGSLTVKIKTRVTPVVEAMLEINKENGSILTGRGNGDIDVEVKTGKGLNIKGDYTLDDGNLHMNLMGLAVRDFTISEGSSIKFNGNVMDSDLKIDAIYKTKASISTLLADTTSVNSRRNIDCSLKVGGKLREPQITFGIDIPDLEPSVKARVENALSTEDKVQRQVIALLVTNNFIQDEQNGINNNSASAAIYSNAANILTNQLNNILSKLNIPLDLGLNYQQNERGNDVFDVAVSTQLFNNRVVINGNIGNRQYKNGNNNSEVAGDIDIEVKIDRSGALRLNLFSHSADQYTNYLDNSQRNGLGVAYQREFNKVAEVFKYMFAGKVKKERLDAEELERLQKEGMKTIVIEE